MEMLGVMTDMDEERKDKVKNFRDRLAHMNSTLDELKLEDEELDKDLKDKLSACFAHQS